MIICLCGTVGSGKSLSAVADMLRHLQAGMIVGSNIELLPDGVDRRLGRASGWRDRYMHLDIDGDHNDPSTWPVGARRGSGSSLRSLIVIDEAAEWIDAVADKSSGRVEAYGSWLRHSDKLGCDVILIVQHWALLHRRIRCLVAEYRVAHDLTRWAVPGLGAKIPWPFNQYVFVTRLDRDARTSLAKPDLYARDRSIFDCYKTAAMYGSSVHTTGVEIAGRVRESSPVWEWAAAAAGVMAYFW